MLLNLKTPGKKSKAARRFLNLNLVWWKQTIHETTRMITKMLLVIFRGNSWIVFDFRAYLMEQADEEMKFGQHRAALGG